jgi:phenylalanyl-tRNA synthetase beta chain
MRFSEQWLRTWVDTPLSAKEMVDVFTMAGLEVDAIEPAAPLSSGVVVAEVMSAQPHPTHKKLTVCMVSIGQGEPLQVVCGAKNARQGIKVAYAAVGSVLPEFPKITERAFGDIVSKGMLCAWSELGIENSGEGIIELPNEAPNGESIWDYLELNDHCIEIDLTPNRGDCLSLQGLARELSAIAVAPLKAHSILSVAPTCQTTFPIQIEADEACLHYVGRVIDGVNAQVKTPIWMIERLRRSGIHSISIVVDILNYVMIELGQPLHAFDFEKLKGGIHVRFSKENEKITLLDGQNVTLKPNTLLIADQNAPVAIAGIMGGLDSGVTLETKKIFIESALFSQKHLAGQARRYGLATDASSRFERGVDPNLQTIAIERVTVLILELCGGQAGPVQAQKTASAPLKIEITLRYAQVERVLGLKFSEAEIEDFLTRLHANFDKEGQSWKVLPPSYRYDLTEEIDLIEECGRLYGYNLIPIVKPVGSFNSRTGSESAVSLARCKRILVDAGYHEVITYSFVNPKIQTLFDFQNEVGLRLKNPISQDMSEMRMSLWPGLAGALQYNQQRQQSRLKIFESGLVFKVVEGELIQVPMLSGFAMGNLHPDSWGITNRPLDFFDIKGDVERLAMLMQSELTCKPHVLSAMHPGQSASLHMNDKCIGVMGALHPELEKALDLNGPVFAFELELQHLTVGKLTQYEKLSKFPLIRRDLAMVVAEDVAAHDILALTKQSGGDLLKAVNLFDLYQGKGVPSGKKSLAIALILQANSRTLTDEEVDTLVKDVMSALQSHFAAELRE